MCSCEDNPQLADSTKIRTARTFHACDNCGGDIAPGERYQRVKGIWAEGGPDDFPLCLVCVGFGAEIVAAGECWCVGMMGMMGEAIAEMEDAPDGLAERWAAHVAAVAP